MSTFKNFDPNNISNKQLDSLRGDVYGGYRTRSVARYEMRGAGSGRAMRQTGYRDVFSPTYYQNHAGWSGIARKVGIKNINSTNDVRAMYDFVQGYRPPAPAAPAPAPAQRSGPTPEQTAFSKQAADMMKRAEAALAESKKPRPILTNQSSNVNANPLQIGPAESSPKSSGVDSFKRKKSTTNPMKILTSNALNI